MCGITGYIDWAGGHDSTRIVQEMNTTQIHRGPDSQDVFTEGNLSIGSVRLSILDINKRSRMPMKSPDGNHILVFNGEIYNFKSLRTELESAGTGFSTTSDTEVLLQLLMAEGQAGISKLDGMFTFAYYNKNNRELLLARDRIGMKPLFYSRNKNHFIFSSEQKSIYKVKADELTISEQGISDLFNIGYNYGTTSLTREIKCLLPGHSLKINIDTSEISETIFHDILNNFNESTWNKKLNLSEDSIEHELETDILNSVEQHTVSDAEMGVICSGGVDSSLLSVFANRFRPDIELYHASITGGINEQKYAEIVAQKIKSPLHVTVIDKENYMGNWAKCIYHNDTPSYHPNDIPLFLVCQQAQSQGKKVLISGEGADELFGGYNVNLELKKRLFWNSFLNRVPGRIISLLKGLFESYFQGGFPEDHRDMMNIMGITSTARIKGFLFSQPLIYSNMQRFIKSGEIMTAMSFLNAREKLSTGYMTERLFSHLITLLIRNDKMGMAASIETRIPFLSNTLIDKWVCMPSKFKINGSNHQNLKFLLKKIAARYLPSEILYRPKVGFSIPLSGYLNLNDNFLRGGYLQDHYKIKDNMLNKLYYDSGTFYKIVSLEIWCQLFLLENSVADIQKKINSQLIHH